MKEDSKVAWSTPKRYTLIYLIFVQENLTEQGHTVDALFPANSIAEIAKKIGQLETQDEYVGVVGIQDKNGDYV